MSDPSKPPLVSLDLKDERSEMIVEAIEAIGKAGIHLGVAGHLSAATFTELISAIGEEADELGKVLYEKKQKILH